MADFYTEGPLTTVPKPVSEGNATMEEAFGYAADQLDINTTPRIAREARYFDEDVGNVIGTTEHVSQEDAEKELKALRLDKHITIPVGGMSRYQLNAVTGLKQREIDRAVQATRIKSWGAGLASFTGALGAQAVDPINIGSGFVPFIAAARYEAMLANAGTNLFARAGVRAGLGAVEGVGGAVLVEPINYLTAQHEQADYGLRDSFVNIVFGGVIGSVLHPGAGAVYDWRVARALRSLDEGLGTLGDDGGPLGPTPQHVTVKALEADVRGIEDGTPGTGVHVLAQEAIDAERLRVAERERGSLTPEQLRAVEAVEAKEAAPPGATEADTPTIKEEADAREPLDVADEPGAAQEPDSGITLERATYDKQGEGEHYFKIKKDGKEVGYILGYLRGNKEGGTDFFVSNMSGLKGGAKGGIGSLGPGAVRGLFKALRSNLPAGVTHVSGVRVSGARGQALGPGAAAAPPVRAELPSAEEAPTVGDTAQRLSEERQISEARSARAEQDAKDAHAGREPTVEDLNETHQMAIAHLESMRGRGLFNEDTQRIIDAADAEAKALEEEAKAYEALGICGIE